MNDHDHDNLAAVQAARERKAEQRRRAIETMRQRYGTAAINTGLPQVQMYVSAWYTDRAGNRWRFVRAMP